MEDCGRLGRMTRCVALAGALLAARAAAASYDTPDYAVNANVKPFTTSGPITIVYSSSNLSDVTAPATTVEFSAAPASDPSKQRLLGQASVPSLSRWSSVQQTISFPIPSWAPVGYTAMRLFANINPARNNGEVKTGNNITASGFALQVASAPPPPPPPPSAPPAALAPPAETDALAGFGAATPGGAGKTVYTVTSLGAAGPGTLADAVSQGNRYVKFAVAGVIKLTEPIRVKGSFTTIDGFSAPAPGITLQGAGLYMMNRSTQYGFDYGTHDVIVRGIRVRNSVDDAFRIAYSAYNIVLDHVSAWGAGDGSIDITEDSHDVTVQWSIFADPLSQKNSLLAYRPSRISMHHNLFINSDDRNPAASFSYDGAPARELTLDFRNNVVSGWDSVGSRILYGSQANMVNNYYNPDGGRVWNTLIVCRPGASWTICNNGDPRLFARAYVAGNIGVGLSSGDLNRVGTESSAFAAAPVATQSACTAARQVQASAGALPHDAVDNQSLAAVRIPSDVCP